MSILPALLIAVVTVQSNRLDQIMNDQNVVTGISGVETIIDSSTAKSIAASQVTNDVASWAMKGSPAPVADLTPAFNYTTAVSNKLEQGKQDKISDLDDIRLGAELGATAVQPSEISDMATKTWVGSQGYLTSLAPAFSYTTDVSNKLEAAKQDVISDLYEIRQGATAGSTAVQPDAISDMATKTWVKGKQYVTKSVTNGLASQSWVENKQYVTKSITNGLATTTYVDEKVAGATPGDYLNVSNAALSAKATLNVKESVWDAKQNAISDYTTTNATCNLITNNVASWAMHGKEEPVTDLSPAIIYTTAVSNKLEISKQDVISDLTTIRQGAAAGSTAVQPDAISDMATQTWVGQQKLANPNALSFTGSVSGSYDGSSAKSINIPSTNGLITSSYVLDTVTKTNIDTFDLPASNSIVDRITNDRIKLNVQNRILSVTDNGTAIWSGSSDTVSAHQATNIAKDVNATTRAIVQTWESFLDGSNVVFSITNYISGAYNLNEGKFKVLEMTNGVYREVYNSRDEIILHVNNFKNTDFATATNQVITSVNSAIAGKADKAWGKYTSAGGDAPSNTVYMTAPNTVFAGGLEYERVAVGEGSVCILTTCGAPTYTQGDEGTFKFQDDGGTNYFGFAKTDSYVIGANASGISVQNHIVTINYDVTMSGVPCIWYKADIASDVAWEQLNTPDGNPIAGASHIVSWEQNPPAGRETCYINCQEAKGFFKATIEVAGSAKFMTNMPADLGGGILCTNTATGVIGIIKPSYNGSQVFWNWSNL